MKQFIEGKEIKYVSYTLTISINLNKVHNDLIETELKKGIELINPTLKG